MSSWSPPTTISCRTTETAAILGWEGGADPAHLSERRRFFTIWLARLLGMDFSTDLAHYLFRAGKFHAAHGPRRTHVPPVYVTGSISLVNATFARFLVEEMPGSPVIPQALAGWNKVLTLHLHLMQLGYQAAMAVDSGDHAVKFALFGRMRTVTGVHELDIHLADGATAQGALRKFFNYFPQARQRALRPGLDGRRARRCTGHPLVYSQASLCGQAYVAGAAQWQGPELYRRCEHSHPPWR